MTKSSLFLLLLPMALGAQAVAPPASAIFDKDTVHEIRLTFSQADWYEQLISDYDKFPDDTPYREASLIWGEYKFDIVGVRFKGNSSYRGATTKKKPFRIKLNEFVKGQKIEGMASFGLSNAWNDPSFVREKPYYELAASAGLAAPRSSFAALYVNGTYWGLYVLGEIVNGDFLKAHFAKNDDGGNLYKGSDPGANLAYRGTDKAAYKTTFSKETNEDADDWTDLIELTRVFDQTPIADLPGVLDKLIDVDSFLMALALDNATVNLDSYVGLSQNYYLYRRPSDSKWVWIPWDPSLAFGAQAQGLTVQQLKELPLEWIQSANAGGPGGGNGGINTGSAARPVATKMWQVPAYKARYRQIYQSFIDQQLVPATVVARMNALRTLIRPSVEKDTQKLVTQAQFDSAMTQGATSANAPGGPAGGTPGLQPFIEGRVTAVKALLNGQVPLQVTATPASVFLAQAVGSASGVTQSISLALSDATKTGTFTATSSVSWITFSAATGPLPATLRLAINATGMTAGTYSGAVQINVDGTSNSPIVIPVVMGVIATPGLVANPPSITVTTVNGGGPGGPGGQVGGTGATTQTIDIASTAGASAFTAVISDSTCTNFLTVTPLTGTTPATLTVTTNAAGATGTCSGRITITSSGVASAVIPVTQTVGGGAGGGRVTPVISAIVNSASYANGSVSPGSIVSIFGTNLGPATGVSGTFSAGQLTTNLTGIQVTFDGAAAPMIYARSNQVSAVVPFEVAGKTQVMVQLSINGVNAPPFLQTVSPTAPGIFTTASNGSGQASIINQTGAVNGPNTAAAKGSIVSIYLTGAGQMAPAGRTGAVGTAAQLISAPVTVNIGGQSSTVTYAGAAAGSLQGLYQINATVPAGSASGSVPLQVTIGGASAQNAVTLYIQ